MWSKQLLLLLMLLVLPHGWCGYGPWMLCRCGSFLSLVSARDALVALGPVAFNTCCVYVQLGWTYVRRLRSDVGVAEVARRRFAVAPGKGSVWLVTPLRCCTHLQLLATACISA